MHERPKTFVSWSSGKDSAFALWKVREERRLEPVGLLTTVTRSFGRVSMHGVRESLLEAQADAVGLPLLKVEIPFPCPNEVYERAMAAAVDRMRSDGARHIVFGDLFLEDIRAYRESRLAGTGLEPVFPLWGQETSALAREMLLTGLEAYLVCVDPRKLDRSFAGRRFDERLLSELPASVDPCGERGEFHTFVANGPMFSRRVQVDPGEVVDRDGFVFADLVPR
jgi:uncharacterized protein (TIGR00290 family)